MDHAVQSIEAIEKLEKYEQLAEVMLGMPQVSIPVKHTFGPGVYMREITIPAGTFALGHAHKHDCINIVVSGKASMLGDDGQAFIMEAPKTFVSKAFTQKFGYIIEDLTHITVHANPDEVRDLDQLEEMFLVESTALKNHIEAFGELQKLQEVIECQQL